MGPSGPPLLIVCALRMERFALRGGGRARAAAGAYPRRAKGEGPPVVFVRTGMGPQAAERAVTEALRDPALDGAPVLTTGFCAGLATGMRPGDVVVADGPQDGATLAAALKAAGHTVHIGRLAESDHVVRGPERLALRSTGAIAVDMESAAMMRAALARGPRPVAAARVVVDTPEFELVRLGTLRTGITAFRVLRDLLPAFLDWHRSTALPWR
ncbi:1-hydroxy-2-methyl-2-butenyl 4-diphosphate reductase [Streptomyces sp. NPDC002574]|uniref:phosphorylase family protein n=1 Tax=Streptomyces sp. NPDC002574 TaxID=3364652 RepID=UPI0036A0030C